MVAAEILPLAQQQPPLPLDDFPGLLAFAKELIPGLQKFYAFAANKALIFDMLRSAGP
jgi:hypothetical protein